MIDMMLREVGTLPSSNIVNTVNRLVCSMMDKSSLFYRVFSRVKSSKSIESKFKCKNYNQDKKMQDLLGTRIVLYFKDDIPICRKIIENTYVVVGVSEDIEDDTNFKATKLNYVCKLPDEVKALFDKSFWDKYYIDDTFEIQIRTIFSEGWHEIEHDLRYKCKSDWKNEDDISRTLNGIFATLETCDWSILTLFEQLSYKKYKDKCWEAMIRNKLRLRLASSVLDPKIESVLNRDLMLAKEFIKVDREELILRLCFGDMSKYPKTMDNIVYIANLLMIKNEAILELTPEIMKNKYNS